MRAFAGALLLLGLAAGPACAAVFEIADDGSVQMRSGTGAIPRGSAAADLDDDSATIDGVPDVPAAALTQVADPDVPPAYATMLIDAARRYDVSPSLLAALVARESAWQPAAISAKGAIGLAQLMPATARALAVDPRNAASNLSGAAHYLRQMLDLFDGDVERALAAYNAGPRRVLTAGGIPRIRETQAYVSTIIDRLAPAGPVHSMGEIR